MADTTIEDVLTWEEVNALRVVVVDHRLKALADFLVAKDEGHPWKAAEAKLERARRLERKVTEMFYRLSARDADPAASREERP